MTIQSSSFQSRTFDPVSPNGIDRILIADDHEVVREGLARALRTSRNELMIDFVSSHAEVSERIRTHNYKAVVLDLRMENHRIFDAVQRLLEKHPDLRILIYSAYPAQTFAYRFLRMGAMGYVNKQEPLDRVVEAVFQVMRGDHVVNSKVFKQVMFGMEMGAGSVLDELSDREFEILVMMVNGNNSAEIADQLCIHSSTVGTYKHRIYTKLGTTNLADITLIALQHQIIH